MWNVDTHHIKNCSDQICNFATACNCDKISMVFFQMQFGNLACKSSIYYYSFYGTCLLLFKLHAQVLIFQGRVSLVTSHLRLRQESTITPTCSEMSKRFINNRRDTLLSLTNHNAIEIMPPRALPTARDIEISFHANSSSSWPANRSTAQGRVRARPTSKCGTTSRRSERCAMKTKVVACECCATPGLRRATQQKHISGVLVA